jgi:hypothetical protein
MAYRRIDISFPRAVLVMYVLDLTVFTLTASAAPSFRPLLLTGSLTGRQSVQVYHHHPPLLISGEKTT